MNDVYHDNETIELELSETVAFPTSVKIAGIIWITYGSLQLIGNLSQLAMNNSGVGASVGWLIAFVFLLKGIQTVKGKTQSVLLSGMGSAIYSLLILFTGLSLLLVSIGAYQSDKMSQFQLKPSELIFDAVICLGMGTALFLAGCLAIAGQGKYKAWRNVSTEQ